MEAVVGKKKAALAGGFLIWRLPTLAEPIEPLPSAALRLTAEFGMGSGRTAALLPPENHLVKNSTCRGGFTENYTWGSGRRHVAEFYYLPKKGRSSLTTY